MESGTPQAPLQGDEARRIGCRSRSIWSDRQFAARAPNRIWTGDITYNRRRRHSTLGYRSPQQFMNACLRRQTPHSEAARERLVGKRKTRAPQFCSKSVPTPSNNNLSHCFTLRLAMLPGDCCKSLIYLSPPCLACVLLKAARRELHRGRRRWSSRESTKAKEITWSISRSLDLVSSDSSVN